MAHICNTSAWKLWQEFEFQINLASVRPHLWKRRLGGGVWGWVGGGLRRALSGITEKCIAVTDMR